MSQYSYFQSLNGAVSVAAAPAVPFTEAQADRLAHAGACFDIVNGRAVQVMHPMGADGYAPMGGKSE